jgi:hypothetical protein
MHIQNRMTGLFVFCMLMLLTVMAVPTALIAAEPIPAPESKLPAAGENKIITEADVTSERVGTSIPV